MHIFFDFSRFFWNRFRKAFFEGKGANLRSKVGFWSHLRRPRDPKINIQGVIFRKKVSKNLVPRIPGSVLEPFGAPFGTQNAPRTDFHRFGVDFETILDRFRLDSGLNLDRCFMDFSDIRAL